MTKDERILYARMLVDENGVSAHVALYHAMTATDEDITVRLRYSRETYTPQHGVLCPCSVCRADRPVERVNPVTKAEDLAHDNDYDRRMAEDWS